jgi:hypothetical protein
MGEGEPDADLNFPKDSSMTMFVWIKKGGHGPPFFLFTRYRRNRSFSNNQNPNTNIQTQCFIHDDISLIRFVIPGSTRNPVFFWIPAFAGMTAFAIINVAVYKSLGVLFDDWNLPRMMVC